VTVTSAPPPFAVAVDTRVTIDTSDTRVTIDTSAATDDIPFCRTEITEAARLAAMQVLASGWVTMGTQTMAFEGEFAAWVGARHAVAVSSCTDALEMALAALGLPPGSPVLTPTLTFCGAVQAIVRAGLRPVLVDVDEGTLGVSVDTVSTAARRGAAAMVVQHMGGYPLDSAELAAAAGIDLSYVVEDAAHGLGATVGGRAVGNGARAVCFSFYATKNLPIWDGGAITTDDEELADRLRRVRLHGMSQDAWRRYHRSGTWRYTVAESGMKANFTDVQAAVGREQLRSLAGWQRRRGQIAARYDEQLSQVGRLDLPPRPPADQHAWHLYIVRVRDGFGSSRDDVVESLAAAGIGTSVHFIPVHHQPYFRRLLGPTECDSVPVADAVFPTLLSLPMHPGLSDPEIDRVAETLAALAAR
jgi:dTDP-4-amino-4,6-dideoxygalactose transaminase